MNNNSIGVFDSGIGGFTVVKEILRILPNENIIYVGDTARVPYGTRGKDVITKFALELTKFILKQKVKLLVVACNTISATCLDEIEKISSVPVVGVIKPIVSESVRRTKSKKVGVIGTGATIRTGIYEVEIQKLDKNIHVISQACPLFVSLVEAGFINHKSTKLISDYYLEKFKGQVDLLILGCTHYPLLKKIIQESVGKDIVLIDSAKPTAMEVKKILEKNNLLSSSNNKLASKFYVTDITESVIETTNLFFNNLFPGKLKKVTLE